jgi:hypothetical protein
MRASAVVGDRLDRVWLVRFDHDTEQRLDGLRGRGRDQVRRAEARELRESIARRHGSFLEANAGDVGATIVSAQTGTGQRCTSVPRDAPAVARQRTELGGASGSRLPDALRVRNRVGGPLLAACSANPCEETLRQRERRRDRGSRRSRIMVCDVFVFHDSGSAQSTVAIRQPRPVLGRGTSIPKRPNAPRPDSGRLSTRRIRAEDESLASALRRGRVGPALP